MHLNKLEPGERARCSGASRSAHAVPGAGSNYGYSETSAPICAEPPRDRRRRRLRVRRPRVRDGVDDRPAAGLAEPGTGRSRRSSRAGARASRIVGGGAVWTPVTVDPRRTRVFFGTGSATPLYFPSIRPGHQPAHRLADRRRPQDRPDEVVAAADRGQPVVVRRRAAAARLRRQGRRQDAPRRLGRDDGRRLVRVRREHRRAVLPARQGDRPRRAPGAAAGQAGDGVPVELGGLNYSPASYDPTTDYVFNAAAETAARRYPGEADADAEEEQVRARRRLPRARERQLRHRARRAGTTTARSARSTSTPASASGSSRRPSRSAAA